MSVVVVFHGFGFRDGAEITSGSGRERHQAIARLESLRQL